MKWIAAINRKDWQPTEYSRLCFITGKMLVIVILITLCIVGKPSKDQSHPDYVPSCFAHQASIRSTSTSSMDRFDRASLHHKRRRVENQPEIESSTDEVEFELLNTSSRDESDSLVLGEITSSHSTLEEATLCSSIRRLWRSKS